MKEKELIKYMNQKSWYHGTTLANWKNLCDARVQVNHNIGVELDFGYGFYLTPRYQQAEGYIKRILPYLKFEGKHDEEIPVVIEFELDLTLFEDSNSKSFLKFDVEFAAFVFKNRMNPKNRVHNYDYIIGVMTDSNPIELIRDFKTGDITEKEVEMGLRKGNSMQQLSLHRQILCDTLRVKKVTIIETGKELNANDYNRREVHNKR